LKREPSDDPAVYGNFDVLRAKLARIGARARS
jgi:hypothetical protein